MGVLGSESCQGPWRCGSLSGSVRILTGNFSLRELDSSHQSLPATQSSPYPLTTMSILNGDLLKTSCKNKLLMCTRDEPHKCWPRRRSSMHTKGFHRGHHRAISHQAKAAGAARKHRSPGVRAILWLDCGESRGHMYVHVLWQVMGGSGETSALPQVSCALTNSCPQKSLPRMIIAALLITARLGSKRGALGRRKDGWTVAHPDNRTSCGTTRERSIQPVGTQRRWDAHRQVEKPL